MTASVVLPKASPHIVSANFTPLRGVEVFGFEQGSAYWEKYVKRKTVPWFQIGVPELKPHDLRHGVAMDVLEQHHGFEQMRALYEHTPIETT